jgi:hypothetical protein
MKWTRESPVDIRAMKRTCETPVDIRAMKRTRESPVAIWAMKRTRESPVAIRSNSEPQPYYSETFCLHNNSLMMEAEKVSSTLDFDPEFTRMVVPEDFYLV